MKTISILKSSVLLLMVLVITGCAQKDQARHIIEHFRQELAGDPRENVFEIDAEKSGNKSFILRGETDNPALLQIIIDSLHNHGFSVSDSIIVLPEQTEYPWGIVTLSTANLRAEPRHRSELVSQALMGTPVKILKKQKYWAFIQTPDNYLSWIENAAMKQLTHQELIDWQKSEKVIVTSPFVAIADSNTGLPVSDAVWGCILEVIASHADTWEVQLPDGRTGLLPQTHLQPFTTWKEQTEIQGEELLATAFGMTGIPYLWGGTSNKGIDCSGYTKTIYFLNGVILARDASLQVRHGLDVPVNKGTDPFIAGDLLFFSARPENDTPITHVGMYLGNHKFIHASGKVKVNSLNPEDDDYDEYNTSRLKFVKRIAGAEKSQGIVPVKNHPWY